MSSWNPRVVLDQLRQLGWRPSKGLGQHFLRWGSGLQSWPSWIAALVERVPNGSVVEIGPGAGALTQFLEPYRHRLILIEADQQIAAFWQSQGVTVWQVDALSAHWWHQLDREWVLLSNTPYNISAPLVIRMSQWGLPRLKGALLMMQQEVADKFLARKGRFNALHLMMAPFWRIQPLILRLKGTAFEPPTPVESAVLRFDPLDSLIPLEERFFWFVFIRKSFSQPRKTIGNNWRQVGWHELIHIVGLPSQRPHEWDLSQWLAVWNQIPLKVKMQQFQAPKSDFH